MKYSTIFLDRDGVINEERKDYVKSIDEFKIIDGSLDAIKLLIAGGGGGLVAWLVKSTIMWPIGFWGLLAEVGFSAAISIWVFTLIGSSLRVKEINELTKLILGKTLHL